MAQYYIDFELGSDTNTGLTISTPWKHCPGDTNATGNAAATSLSPGDIVEFKGGVRYVGNIIANWSGTAGNPILYRTAEGWGSGLAIISTDYVEGTGINLTGRSYVDIYGIKLYQIGGYTEDDPIWTTKYPVTVDVGANTIVTAEPHGLTAGQVVAFTMDPGNTAPGGMTPKDGTNNWVDSVVSPTHFRVRRGDKFSDAVLVTYTTPGTGGLYMWKSVTNPKGGTGIRVADASHINIEDCQLHEIGSWRALMPMNGTNAITGVGISLQNSSNVTIRGCDFARMRNPVSLKVATGGLVSNILCEDLSIHDHVVWGFDVAPRSANGEFRDVLFSNCRLYDWIQTDLWQGSGDKPHRDGWFFRHDYVGTLWTRVRITRAKVWNDFPEWINSRGGTASIYISQGPSLQIDNCIFLNDPHGNGIITIGGSNKSGQDQFVYILNNTFVCGARPVYCSGSCQANVVKVLNNVIYRDVTINNLPAVQKPAAYPLSFECDYNLYYTNSNLTTWRMAHDGSYRTFAQWQALGHDTHSYVANPSFTSRTGDAGTWDLTLQPTSLAIDTGLNIGADYGYTHDYAGSARSTPWDLGALQYGTVVDPVLTAPTISTHPASQAVNVGIGTVTFSVVAAGNPTPSYQWRKDGVDIPGATSSSYTITAPQLGDAGSYSVRVSNSEGFVISNSATLTVILPAVSNNYLRPRHTARRMRLGLYQPVIVIPDPDPDPGPGLVSSVTWDVFTWSFAEPVVAGTFADGKPWVHRNGLPVNIVSITPSYEAVAGASYSDPAYWHTNGSMLNMVPARIGYQGLDSNVNRGNNYDHTKNIAAQLPYAVAPGNTVVSSQSWPTKWTKAEWVAYQGGNNDNWYQIKRLGFLTVLASTPPAGSFRPSVHEPAGSKTIIANVSDIDVSFLLNLPHPTSLPDLATLEARSHQMPRRIQSNWQSHYLSPLDGEYGYGRQAAHNTGAYLAALNCNYTSGEKQTLLHNVIQHGIDIYGGIQHGMSWHADGGHNLGWKPYLVFAAVALNHAGMLARADWDQFKLFQDDQQHWYVSAADVGRVVEAGNQTYTSAMIGTPEWGIRHYNTPSMDDSAWSATYRNENYAPNFGIAVVMQMMGLNTAWNNPAYFDYLLNRVWAVSGGTSGFGTSPNTMRPWARDWRLAHIT